MTPVIAMNTSTDICASCAVPLPEFGEPCPACGAISFFCTTDGCGSVISTAMATCPACGQANGDYQPPAASELAVASAPPPPPPQQQPEPEPAYVSPLLEAAAVAGPTTAPPAAKPAAEVEQVSPLMQAAMTAALARPAPSPVAPALPTVAPPTVVAIDTIKLPVPPSIPATGPTVSTAPKVRLMVFTAGPLKVGEQAIVQLRVTGDGLAEPVELRGEIETSWQRGARQWRPQRLTPAGRCDLPPVRMVPTRPGAEAAVVRMELVAGGAVIERATGTVRLEVKRDPTGSGPPSVRDMFEMFDRGGKSDGTDGWQPVELTHESPDELVVPRNAVPWPAGVAVSGPVYGQVDVVGSASTVTTLVSVGTTAAFGRGGMGDVCWWVRPAPFDDAAWKRLSRGHVRLSLADGQLWATDVSTAGTTLDGEPLPPNRRTVVHDGSVLDLAGVVRLRVALVGDGRRVTGAVFGRQDALSNRLAYALVDSSTPAPLLVPAGSPPRWACGWSSAAVTELDATGLPATAATARWQPCDAPRDQNQVVQLTLNP